MSLTFNPSRFSLRAPINYHTAFTASPVVPMFPTAKLQPLLRKFPRPTTNHSFFLRNATTASLSARERRRQQSAARKNAYLDIKHQVESRPHDFISAVVSIPSFVRNRCNLTHRLARVKVLMENHDLNCADLFRERIRSGLVSIFPELQERRLLGVSDGFDIRVGGGKPVTDDDLLREGLGKCQSVGTAVFVEVIPHNIPPQLPPLSNRVWEVQERARFALTDPKAKLQMISFYKFSDISNPKLVCDLLYKAWSRMGITGRVYVANEGINAQISVPEAILQDFNDAMVGSWLERGETVVPKDVVGVNLNKDRLVDNDEQPFEKLHVRPREKILADGFDAPLDWNAAGREVPPEDWHKLLTEQKDDFLLLDCRNSYESDVGKFAGAEPLNTKTFRDSWAKLEEKLRGENRGKKILTYCTGGIRCVKVNAFLEQKMGFTNTGRLQGGIVSYARNLREKGSLEESQFKGVNHVFDGRMGETITDDLLDNCINCGAPCNHQTDCSNIACPRPFQKRIFVQCPRCAEELSGACSDKCLQTLKSSGMVPARASVEASEKHFPRRSTLRDDYADFCSVSESQILSDLRTATLERFGVRARMLSSRTQAAFLQQLIHIAGSRRVIEIGTFTGYATLAMAEALPADGVVITCESSDECADVANDFFQRDVDHGPKIQLRRGRAGETISQLLEAKTEPFDFAFIDADKSGYLTYLTTLLDQNLIRIGGVLAFDNTLFYDEVPNVWARETGQDTIDNIEDLNKSAMSAAGVKKNAVYLHDFNVAIRAERRVEQVLLPFGDGLTIARRIE